MYRDVTDQAPCFPFYFRQVRAGDHENFHYAIGDPLTKDAAVVDPAFELDTFFSVLERDGMRPHTALFTHGHWDHIGGVPVIAEYGIRRIVLHAAAADHPQVQEARDADMEVRFVEDHDVLHIGSVPVEVLHTPGHQPESTCYLAGKSGEAQALFGGDCLFIDSCGRTDFPGGDTQSMFESIARIRALPGDIHVLPGHDYADRPSESLQLQRSANPALVARTRATFDALPFLRD